MCLEILRVPSLPLEPLGSDSQFHLNDREAPSYDGWQFRSTLRMEVHSV